MPLWRSARLKRKRGGRRADAEGRLREVVRSGRSALAGSCDRRGGARAPAPRTPAQRAPVRTGPAGSAAPRACRRDAGVAARGAAGPGARLLRAAGRLVPGARAVRRAARAPAAAARPRPAGRATLRGPRAALGLGPAAAHEQRALLARGRRGARRAPGPLRDAGGAARARGPRRAGRLVRALSPLAAPVRALRGAHPPAGLGRPSLLPGGALHQPARRLRVRAPALPPARAGLLARARRAAPVQTQGGVPGAARGPAALDRLQRGQQPAAQGRVWAQRCRQGPVTATPCPPASSQGRLPARPWPPGPEGAGRAGRARVSQLEWSATSPVDPAPSSRSGLPLHPLLMPPPYHAGHRMGVTQMP